MMGSCTKELSDLFTLARGDGEEGQQDTLDSQMYLGLPRQCPLKGGGRACGLVGPSVVRMMLEYFIALEAPAAGF